MANTIINITERIGLLIPEPSSVPVVVGDSITFQAGEDTPVQVCINPGAAALLNAPASVQIAAGESATFTFSSSAPGNYGIALQHPDQPAPSSIRGPGGAVLGIMPAGKGSSPVPPDDPDDPPPINPPDTEN
jgi:hypothetical protein